MPSNINNNEHDFPSTSQINANNNQSNHYRPHFQLSSLSTHFKIMEKQNRPFQQILDLENNVHMSSMLKNPTLIKDVTNALNKTDDFLEENEQLSFGNPNMSSSSISPPDCITDCIPDCINQLNEDVSPFLYSSSIYESITDDANNNSLLFSNSPCKNNK